MKLEKIISLANKNSELRFLAMVRSLRATGCNLPVWVIPYDDNQFDLPDNCLWWELEEVTNMLNRQKAHPMKRKYQCLLTANYQFVDSDIVFLKNPEDELKNLSGFITSCCHWNNPEYTFTQTSAVMFKEKSTTWQKNVFNAGQFACDTSLYSLTELKAAFAEPAYKECLIDFNYHDQPALNLLVFLTGIKITNITLPPYNAESTWAGDYPSADYEKYWTDNAKKPYLIHWAGCNMNLNRPIDRLFTGYLTASELEAWQSYLSAQSNYQKASTLRRLFNFIKRSLPNT
ncbi:hypothetical protein LX99_00329 [Mucilaginibacter oryzae]|uniref:Glycosyl transferase family 8 n=1 Tax=Mucilaginibacter oryzae TaxID=468058 RepID=A0A316HF70_9SPHI|nr:hypothetical protein [Mucilaginibacter oryzae]PWK79869.1 hypothetical protein LX99_00329 [Mucilaginibacter oryzae]